MPLIALLCGGAEMLRMQVEESNAHLPYHKHTWEDGCDTAVKRCVEMLRWRHGRLDCKLHLHLPLVSSVPTF